MLGEFDELPPWIQAEVIADYGGRPDSSSIAFAALIRKEGPDHGWEWSVWPLGEPAYVWRGEKWSVFLFGHR
jgi:hypothetical protein